ncbi:MAG: SRPBCC family protein [Gemmatimonadaceae bacterium]|nr:SRPBCC family protein [Gemmatimonadaceae bacterium]
MIKTREKVKIVLHGDRELVMTRSFNAPREMIFDAMTKPELLRRWMLGPDGWSMPVCNVDLKVGGSYRWVWKSDKTGAEMGMSGIYREISRPESLVNTERFDESWYPGEAISSQILTESSDRTTLTTTMQYESKAARDGVMASGMERGINDSYDRLEDLLLPEKH